MDGYHFTPLSFILRHVSERKESKQFHLEAEDFPNLTKSESKVFEQMKDFTS